MNGLRNLLQLYPGLPPRATQAGRSAASALAGFSAPEEPPTVARGGSPGTAVVGGAHPIYQHPAPVEANSDIGALRSQYPRMRHTKRKRCTRKKTTERTSRLVKC